MVACYAGAMRVIARQSRSPLAAGNNKRKRKNWPFPAFSSGQKAMAGLDTPSAKPLSASGVVI
jgi:hypothetical protein